MYELPIYTSRGCVGRCSFCMDYKMWSVYYRQKSPERVADGVLDQRVRGENRRTQLHALVGGVVVGATLDDQLCTGHAGLQRLRIRQRPFEIVLANHQ